MTQHQPPAETPEEILEAVYKSIEANKPETALDILFLYANDSYWAGKFENVDKLFLLADLDALGISVALGLLVTGHWARPDLKNREWLVAKVEKWLTEVKKETPERIERLLKGLR